MGREGAEQDGVDQCEDRAVGADAERERERRNRGEPRRLSQHAERIANVLPDCGHQPISPRRCRLARQSTSRQPLAGRMSQDAVQLASQPPPGGRPSIGALDALEFLDRIAEDPFSIGARRDKTDEKQGQLLHSTFSW